MTELVNGSRFAAFAEVLPERWATLQGCTLSHMERGLGKVVAVNPRKGNPLIELQFHESGESAKFNNVPFLAGRIELEVPEKVFLDFREWLAAVEEKERVEQQKEEIRQKEIAAERAVLEEEKKRERAIFESALKKYGPLIEKFSAPKELLVESGAQSPLGDILEKMNSKNELTEFELGWLEGRDEHRLIALYFYFRHSRSHDLWDLVKSSKHLRRANLPQRAIEITEKFSGQSNEMAWSALQTSRGGAYRDLARYDDAISAANLAIESTPTSYHPHMLLGAVYYDLGNYETGDKHFNEGERLGASSRMRDSEIRRKLVTCTVEEREGLVRHLLELDGARYSWVERYR